MCRGAEAGDDSGLSACIDEHGQGGSSVQGLGIVRGSGGLVAFLL